MSNFLSELDSVTQFGRGLVASLSGQTYDVYRLSAKADPSGIITPNSLIASNVAAEFEKMISRNDLEIELSGKVLHYIGHLDMSAFQEGDVFVQRSDSYKFEHLVFTCASNRSAPRQPIFASTPIRATLSRKMPNATNQDTGRAPYGGPIRKFEFVLVQQDGVYSFAQSGTPTSIQIGMVMERLRDYPKSEDPIGSAYDETRRQTWTNFVPDLGDLVIKASDVLTNLITGDRYEVTGIMAETTGYVGDIVTTQRTR